MVEVSNEDMAHLLAEQRHEAASMRVLHIMVAQLLLRMSLMTDNPMGFIEETMQNAEFDLQMTGAAIPAGNVHETMKQNEAVEILKRHTEILKSALAGRTVATKQ